MKTLLELMDDELQKLSVEKEFQHLESFITNDKESSRFISSLNDGFEFIMPNESDDLYEVAQGRARHSAITFLMGMVFKDFAGLYDLIGSTVNKSNVEKANLAIWLMTALNHDRAYTSTHLKNPNIEMRKQFKYDVLSNEHPNTHNNGVFNINYDKTLAYSYATIDAYDSYSRKYHTRMFEKYGHEIERVDHGILGAYINYNELIKKSKSTVNNDTLDMIRVCSLTIAQHNIFKSEKKETDDYYIIEGNLDQLYSTSKFRITSKTALLLLLCLVDTIECVKRFSKNSNPDSSLQTVTVLKNIGVSIKKTSIELDFTNLKKYIINRNSKHLNDEFDKHIVNIKKLHNWTTIRIAEDSYERIILTLNDKSE